MAAAPCDRRTTKWQAQRSAASPLFFLVLCIAILLFLLSSTPLRVFMRWLLTLSTQMVAREGPFGNCASGGTPLLLVARAAEWRDTPHSA